MQPTSDSWRTARTMSSELDVVIIGGGIQGCLRCPHYGAGS